MADEQVIHAIPSGRSVDLSNGYGVPQDKAEAAKWYRMAAEQGAAEAQFNLGVLYDNGYGDPQDYAEAAKWYRMGAEQRTAELQSNLGIVFSIDSEEKQDKE